MEQCAIDNNNDNDARTHPCFVEWFQYLQRRFAYGINFFGNFQQRRCGVCCCRRGEICRTVRKNRIVIVVVMCCGWQIRTRAVTAPAMARWLLLLLLGKSAATTTAVDGGGGGTVIVLGGFATARRSRIVATGTGTG